MALSDISGTPVLFWESLDSTNEEAKRRAQAGALTSPLWLAAGSQQKGRGRQGREWLSINGNLYSSYVIPSPPPREAARLSFACAVSVAEAMAALSAGDVQAECKWPNDVLISGRKAAGILLETTADRYGRDWLIMGLGVNIAGAPTADLLRRPATAFNDHVADAVTAAQFLRVLGERLQAWTARLADHGFEALRAAWMRRAYGLGGRISVEQGGQRLEGQFLGIDEQGAARMRLDSGIETLIHAGEIAFRRERE